MVFDFLIGAVSLIFEERIVEKTNFENLEIYQLSEKLADEIWEIALGWNSLAQNTVGKQLIRSADSIGDEHC